MRNLKFTALALSLALLAGCMSHTVRVTNRITGTPIKGARVVPVYPSIGGPDDPGYLSNNNGIARIGGFGLPQGGYGVYVYADRYRTKFVPTHPTTTNHSGWSGHHMDISLWPVSTP